MPLFFFANLFILMLLKWSARRRGSGCGSLSRRVFLTLTINEVEVRERGKIFILCTLFAPFFDHLGWTYMHSFLCRVEQAYLMAFCQSPWIITLCKIAIVERRM